MAKMNDNDGDEKTPVGPKASGKTKKAGATKNGPAMTSKVPGTATGGGSAAGRVQNATTPGLHNKPVSKMPSGFVLPPMRHGGGKRGHRGG